MTNTKSAYHQPKLRTWGTVEDLTLIGPHNAGQDACEGSGSGMPKVLPVPCPPGDPEG